MIFIRVKFSTIKKIQNMVKIVIKIDWIINLDYMLFLELKYCIDRKKSYIISKKLWLKE